MLPMHFPGFRVADVERTDGRVRISISVDGDAATCPDCGRRRATGLCRVTVRKYLQHTEVPRRAPRPRVPGKITPFIGYLKQRWEAGCYNASQLFREIRALGYDGFRSLVKAFVQPWRTQVDTRVAPVSRPAWKDVRWAALCPPERRDRGQQELAAECPYSRTDLGSRQESGIQLGRRAAWRCLKA